MRRSILLAGLMAATLIVPATAVPASAQPFPDTVPLPVDFQPEGIAVGTGSTFYVGSITTGDIYRGDLRSGTGEVLDVSGAAALGMRVDEARHRLYVAGGPTGHAYVYDTRDGSTVADLTLNPAGGGLVNDVALTRDAAYFTETLAPVIYQVSIGTDGSLGPVTTIPVTGPAGATGGLGLNGIDATEDGSVLVVAHTALGILATVDPQTGESTEIPLSGGALIPDTADGLQLEGRTAWVVENFANAVVEVRLAPDLSSGVVAQTITSPTFRVPTTVARHGDRLALVNARFDLGFPPPFGPGAPPGTEFDVALVRTH